jgi:hypothetical protein
MLPDKKCDVTEEILAQVDALFGRAGGYFETV